MKDMLGEVLARIGQEMATIAETSAALEAIIQHTMAASQSPLDLETFHSLQGMDLMTQKIGDLGRFLAHISSAYCDVPIEMSEALAVLHLPIAFLEKDRGNRPRRGLSKFFFNLKSVV